MKTNLITSALFFTLFASQIFAQERTTVNAISSEISDNLDLRAVASIFGEAKDLEDFERQLNDPKIQISNLDLNQDNQVDYLRVIESVESNIHLVIIQSVLGQDTFQDVATIEVERDRNNNVQIQVVGDVYMYGQNYIYEPVYVQTPIIYNSFWATTYRPYCSVWYWDFYPTYYYTWSPCPVFRYRNNIDIHINYNHHYNYVNVRSCNRAIALHTTRRANYCERTYPNRAFTYRNNNVTNRYELDQTRNIRNLSTKSETMYSTSRNNQNTRDNNIVRENTPIRNSVPSRDNQTIKNNQNTRDNNIVRENTSIRNSVPSRDNQTIKNNQNTRDNNIVRENTPIRNSVPSRDKNNKK
jgi:hypothetical protein